MQERVSGCTPQAKISVAAKGAAAVNLPSGRLRTVPVKCALSEALSSSRAAAEEVACDGGRASLCVVSVCASRLGDGRGSMVAGMGNTMYAIAFCRYC